MSNRYFFSILGAYNHDPTIFEGLTLPSEPWTKDYADLFKTFPQMDKAVLISNLLLECAELSLLHTNTDFLKEEIRLWSQMHALDWQQLYETMFYHYNPIWNKDGVIAETETENETGRTDATEARSGQSGNTRTIANSEKVTETNSGADTITDAGTQDSSVINSVNAFNAGSPTEHDRSVTDLDTSGSRNISYGKETGTEKAGSGTITDAGTSTENVTNTGNSAKDRERDYKRTETGNIGVTMTQQMIDAQRNVIMNMYQYIIGQFKERFCILIW